VAQEQKEIERLLTIFNDARRATVEASVQSGFEDEGFLFGAWGVADAFFWPVLWVSAVTRPFLGDSTRCFLISHTRANCYQFLLTYQRRLTSF
jgi:hypothetical protein